MKKNKTFAIVVLALLVTTAMPLAFRVGAEPSTKGTITGTVYDYSTGEPIPDARVELRLSNQSWMWYNETRTSSGGIYAFEVPPGTFDVLVDNWPNYTLKNMEKFLEVDAGETVTVDLALCPSGRLNGTMNYAGTTEGITGADLLFVNSTSGNAVAMRYLDQRSRDGVVGYDVDAPAGEYDILARSWGGSWLSPPSSGDLTAELTPVSIAKGETTTANIGLQDSGMNVYVHTFGWKWEFTAGDPVTFVVEARNGSTWEPLSEATVTGYLFGPMDWPHPEPFAFSRRIDPAEWLERKPGEYVTRSEFPSDLDPGDYVIFVAIRKGDTLGLNQIWVHVIRHRMEWCYAKSRYSPTEELVFRFKLNDGRQYLSNLTVTYALIEHNNGTDWVYEVLESGEASYNTAVQEYEVKPTGVRASQNCDYSLDLTAGQSRYSWWFRGDELADDVRLTAVCEYPIHFELGFRDFGYSVFTCDTPAEILGVPYWVTQIRIPLKDVDWMRIFYEDVSTPAMDIFDQYLPWQDLPTASDLLSWNNSLWTIRAIPAGEIRGTILDEGTGRPLGGVEVTGEPLRWSDIAQWAWATSDWDGSYRLPVPAGIAYVVKFASSLHEPLKLNNDTSGYTVDEAGAVVTLNVNLTQIPIGTLTGVVFWDVDVDGEYNSAVDMPLSDAWVGINDYSWNFLGGTNTASSGRYTLRVRADTFLRIHTWKNETFRSKPIEGIEVAENETLTLNIPMERSVVVTGMIEGPYWADCFLLDADRNLVMRIGESSGRNFRWSVPQSVRTLLFRTWGDYYPVSVSLPTAEAGSELNIGTVRMNQTTLNAWSYMKDWEPEHRPGDIVKFFVEAINRTADWSGGKTPTTVENCNVTYMLWDSTGQFLSEGAGAYEYGKYLVNVTIPEYAKPGPVELLFTVENSSLNCYGTTGGWFHITTLKVITLQELTPYSTTESPTFQWLVLNASRLPAENVVVEYELYNTTGGWNQITFGTIRGSPNGTYTVSLDPQPEGDYQLHVVFDKQADRWMWFKSVENLTRVTISGHVRDQAGEPVNRATLEFHGGTPEYWVHGVTATNASGYYSIGLLRGGYGTHVTKSSMRTLPEWQHIEIPPRTFDFTLYEVGFLTGRVIDPPETNVTEETYYEYSALNMTLISTSLWNESTPAQSLPATGTTAYTPGVSVGDRVNYTVTSVWETNDPMASRPEGMPPNGTLTLQVMQIDGSNVTFFVEGEPAIYWTDVERGEMGGNISVRLIVASLLNEGDLIFNDTMAPRINSTIVGSFAGAVRLVNMLNETHYSPEGWESTILGWDRSTGILCQLLQSSNRTFTPAPGPEPGPGPEAGYDVGARVLFWNATTGKLMTMEWVWGRFTRSSPTGTYDVTFDEWDMIPYTVYNVTIDADATTDVGEIKLYRVDWSNQLWTSCSPWQTVPGRNVTVTVDLSTSSWQLSLSESITGLTEDNFTLYLLGWRWPQPPTGYINATFYVNETSTGVYAIDITVPSDAEAGFWDGKLVISANGKTYIARFGFNLVSLYVGATPQKRNFYPGETLYLVTIVTTPDNAKVTGLIAEDFRIRIYGYAGEMSGNFTSTFYELGHGVYLMEFPIANDTGAGGCSMEVTVTVPGVGSATDWQWFEIAGRREEQGPKPGPEPEPEPGPGPAPGPEPGPVSTGPRMVVASNLTEGDTLFDLPEAPVINATLERAFGGAIRLVNYLDVSESDGLKSMSVVTGWDRSTGILCEYIQSFNETTDLGNFVQVEQVITLTSTTLWNESTPAQSLPATGTTDYTPGVRVGDVANYTITLTKSDPGYDTPDLQPNGTATVEILKIDGSIVKMLETIRESDTGSERTETLWINVETGESGVESSPPPPP